MEEENREGIKSYYISKIEELEQKIRDKKQNLSRLEAQRNEMNNAGTLVS
jgi:26S proteasome regulatory subunit T6